MIKAWDCSSVKEHSTAAGDVSGSIPPTPFLKLKFDIHKFQLEMKFGKKLIEACFVDVFKKKKRN